MMIAGPAGSIAASRRSISSSRPGSGSVASAASPPSAMTTVSAWPPLSACARSAQISRRAPESDSTHRHSSAELDG
jgi:hypothetical protein